MKAWIAVGWLGVLVLGAQPVAAGYGTNVATDPMGDQGLPLGHFDLRSLWLDSDGETLTLTLEVTDLEPGQTRTRYQIAFTHENALPRHPPYLVCWVGPLGSLTFHEGYCEMVLTLSAEDDGVFLNLEQQRTAVSAVFEYEAEVVQAFVPYGAFLGEPDLTLSAFRVVSEACLEAVPRGPFACPTNEDGMTAQTQYVLA